MKQKKKGKFILFASYLRPTEELLWQSAEKVDILSSLIPKPSLSSVVSLALFLMVVGGCGLMSGRSRDDFVGVIGALVGLVGMSLIGLRYIYRWIWHKPIFNMAIPNQSRYAITSERLFYQRGEDLQAESLDNISVIDVLPNNTLNFGAAFPQWSGLDDAEHIKFIIERAQKERLKAVSMSDADEYPLEQEQSYKNSIAK